MKNFLKNIKGDKTIWAVVVLLSILSILTVYSSIVTLAYKYKAGDTEYYLLKHAGTLLGGLFFMYLAHKVRSGWYSRCTTIVLIMAIPLLLLTLISGSNITILLIYKGFNGK